jgi:type IV secretory pathway VirB2 component (pilin)
VGPHAGAVAIVAWAAAGFSLFYGSGDLSVADTLGVALIVFLLPWLLALVAGSASAEEVLG